MNNRRRWLQGAFGAVMGAGVWQTAAAASPAAVQDRPRLLLVFLRGAYDATHVLIPYSSDFYYEARPHIAIARPGSGAGAGLRLDADWALHPALADSMGRLWHAKQLCWVPFTGMENNSRSHFEMQEKIELANSDNSSSRFDSGFLNRLVQELGKKPQAVAFTSRLPTVMRGQLVIPNVTLNQIRNTNAQDNRRQALIAKMYEGTELAGRVAQGFETRQAVEQEFAIEMAANQEAVSPGGFQAVVARISRLMMDRYDVGFMDIGRWDTHAQQGGSRGFLADRLTELGEGLAVLAREMEPVWNHTTVVVMSEFGRTFRENGNRGTDHGHGSAMWVLGGAVRGGMVCGEQVASVPRHLHDNRDWPVLNDYRAVLGGLFARLWNLSPAAIARIFPNVPGRDIGLV